jgi:retinaldehyde-binding protein 1
MRRIAEFKKDYAKVLDNLSPEMERESFTETPTLNILTNKDQKGRRVLIVQCGGLWDPKKVNTDSLFRMFYIVQLIAMLEPSSQINGVVVIMDYEGLSMKQVLALSPFFAKMLLKFLQAAMPLRLKEVHFVRQPKMLFALIWKLFQPLIEEKLRSRVSLEYSEFPRFSSLKTEKKFQIFFHASDMKSLHKYLAPEVLPKNYDGLLPEINYGGKEWFPCVDNYKEHIAKWNTYGFVKKN